MQAAEAASQANCQELAHCLKDKAALQAQLQLAEGQLAEAHAAAGQQKGLQLGHLGAQLKVLAFADH